MSFQPTKKDFLDLYVCSRVLPSKWVEKGSEEEERLKASGWWEFQHHQNAGRGSIYKINEAGKKALEDWLIDNEQK